MVENKANKRRTLSLWHFNQFRIHTGCPFSPGVPLSPGSPTIPCQTSFETNVTLMHYISSRKQRLPRSPPSHTYNKIGYRCDCGSSLSDSPVYADTVQTLRSQPEYGHMD